MIDGWLTTLLPPRLASVLLHDGWLTPSIYALVLPICFLGVLPLVCLQMMRLRAVLYVP